MPVPMMNIINGGAHADDDRYGLSYAASPPWPPQTRVASGDPTHQKIDSDLLALTKAGAMPQLFGFRPSRMASTWEPKE
jgi:hypothetical protein